MRTRVTTALVTVGLVVGGSLVAAGPASAALPRAAVSLGDSYISGEAGRWQGNSADSTGSHGGTDRAFDGTQVYGTSGACHRSDVAPIAQIQRPGRTAINLACSGASTVHVKRASAGGSSFNGERPQNDQLFDIAHQYTVDTIALSIGGNDFGFASIVTNCVVAYLSAGTPCHDGTEASIAQQAATVQAAILAVINDIRATMSAAGQSPQTYKVIVHTYPVGLPLPANARYAEADPARSATGNCPFYDSDMLSAHDTATRMINQVVINAAHAGGAQVLDLTPLFNGHELCSAATSQPTGTPNAATNEWLRWIDLPGQGSLNESFHPNAFGQRAIGRCLLGALLRPDDLQCRGVPNSASVSITPLA